MKVLAAVVAAGVTLMGGTAVALNETVLADVLTCAALVPGGSLNAAYQSSDPGCTISVPAGNYGAQDFLWRSLSGQITFDLQPGVVLGTTQIFGQGVYLKGTCSGPPGPNRTYSAKMNGRVITITDDPTRIPENITVECIDVNGFAVYDSRNVTLRNNDFGGRKTVSGCGYVDENGVSLSDMDENKIGARLTSAAQDLPQNVTLDGNYIHDTDRTQAGEVSDCHDGALFVINCSGCLFTRNVWSQNWVYDMLVQNFNDKPPAHNVTVENNWFGCGVEPTSNPIGPETTSGNVNVCNGQMAIQFDSPVRDWLVRFNTTGPGAPLVGCIAGQNACGLGPNIRVVGNVGGMPSCESVISYSYNATDRPCGTTDVFWNGSLVSTTVGVEDFHVANLGNAENLVPQSADSDLFMDFDGDSSSAPRDAGSDQLGGSSTTTSTTLTTTTTTTTETPTPDPDRVLFCSEFVPFMQAVPYYFKWTSQNPGEQARWEPFRDELCLDLNPVPPVMLTNFGKALIAAGKEAF